MTFILIFLCIYVLFYLIQSTLLSKQALPIKFRKWAELQQATASDQSDLIQGSSGDKDTEIKTSVLIHISVNWSTVG